jgi:hypothetical protein
VAWVRGAAIRPVPTYAVVERAILESIERELADEREEARAELDKAFQRFEVTQPAIADAVSGVLARPLDETALALGYFLSIAIWLAFERTFEGRLGRVSEDALKATEDALTLEEELRASHADEPFDLDDVIAMEQPGVLSFVHGHVEAALEPIGREPNESGEVPEVDVDDVHLVYRAILVLTLALSHAVTPEAGNGALGGKEMMA